jgi:S-layer protein
LVTTGNNTVTAGDGANSFTASTGNNTYTGGTGGDTVILGNTGGTGLGVNTINVGTGADVVTVNASSATGTLFSTITGMGVGDTLNFFNFTNGLGAASTFTIAKIADLGSLAVFSDYLAAGSTAVAATNSNFTWFQYGGNTYVIEDNSDALTFQDGVDSVVCLAGLVTVNGFTAGATSTFTLA